MSFKQFFRKKEELDEKFYEKCVSCNMMLPVLKTTSIHERLFYVEGAGQLCHDCYNGTYPD